MTYLKIIQSVVHVLCHLLQWVRSYWEGICNLPKGSVQEITTTHKYLFRKGIPSLPQSHRRRAWDPVNSHLTAAPAHYHMHKEGWLSTWRHSSRKTGSGRLSVIHIVKNPHALKPEHAPAEVQVSVLQGARGTEEMILHLSMIRASDKLVPPKASGHLRAPLVTTSLGGLCSPHCSWSHGVSLDALVGGRWILPCYGHLQGAWPTPVFCLGLERFIL